MSEEEKKVLKAYFDKLVTSIQHSVLEISNKCLAVNLLTPGTHSEVLYASSIPQVQATKLMTAIMDSMEHQNSFHSFLKILDELQIFKELTREIRLSLKVAKHTVKSSKSNRLTRASLVYI